MDLFIRLQNVAKRYRSAHSFVTVLENFDCAVARGEFLAVMGPSGTGKTTLLNLIGGLDRPDSGNVIVAGILPDRLDQHALTRWRAGHWPGQLSGGQQQRVGIARALIANAPILLCDEPTTGLDRAAADLVLGLLRDLSAEGRTVVMVTHDPLAAAFANRRLELQAPA